MMTELMSEHDLSDNGMKVVVNENNRLALDYLVGAFLFLKRGRDYQYSHFFGYSFRASMFIGAKDFIRSRYSIRDFASGSFWRLNGTMLI